VMKPTIRNAVPNDADALFALVEQFATSFKPERDAFDVSFSHLLSDDSACLNLAETDGRVVGYCLGLDHYTFHANGRVSWVEEISVRADFRGQGIGRALMESFEAWAVGRKSGLVALATRRAASFYEALGYKESAAYFRKLLELNSRSSHENLG
jgi:GNAT superfamily N-acetyltransferase